MQVESLAYLQEGVSYTCTPEACKGQDEKGALLLAEGYPAEKTASVS